jgi:hypothetical protein
MTGQNGVSDQRFSEKQVRAFNLLMFLKAESVSRLFVENKGLKR